jgi:peroxiredoxin
MPNTTAPQARNQKMTVKTLLLAASLVATTQALCAEPFHLGQPVSDFTVSDMTNHARNYKALKGKVTVVMFFSTRCPISNAFNFRRNVLYRDYNKRVKFIVVDSNSNESLEEVRAYAKEVGFDFPVYKDPHNDVSDRFGVMATTDSFVLDSSGVIQYHGYIEDSPTPARATKQALRLAIDSVLDGKPVEVAQTSARGCAIRRAKP